MKPGLMRGVAFGLPMGVALWAFIACVGLATLGGCATAPIEPPLPVIKTVEVKVATPVACSAMAKLGPEPSYDDTDGALAAAPDIFESTRLLLKGRLQRTKRLAEYGLARAACTF